MNHHVETPWRTPVIKDDRKEEKFKTPHEAFWWLDGTSRRDKTGSLELQKRKDDATWNQEFLPHEQTPEEGIEFTLWHKNKNYIMLILHQLKLMTSNGFGIPLILVERIKRDIA